MISYLLVTNCNDVADIGFILDSSYSLRNQYTQEKYFLKSLASKFSISEHGIRGSVVTFSSFTLLSIKFNEHYQTSTFNVAVDKIPLIGLKTRIDKALRLTQSQMFTQNNGARHGVPKILILLTDGSQTRAHGAEDPALVAAELRRSGVQLVVIGIGERVDFDELNSIAGDNNRIFTAASFKELVTKDFVSKIFSSACYSKFPIN